MSPLTRREFMKAFGAGLASLVLTACQSSRNETEATDSPTKTSRPKPTQTQEDVEMCYKMVEVIITVTPTSIALAPRNELRACWLSFSEVAAKTTAGENQEGKDIDSNPIGKQLIADHRKALDQLVTTGEIQAPVADLVQEAYKAAVYHVWRSNVPITCYAPRLVDYAPTSAQQLVQQSAVLAEMASKGNLNPDTVAIAQKTIQHDLAYEALSAEQVKTLYQKLSDDFEKNQTTIPSFYQADFEETAEIEAAAEFLVALLSEK